MLVVTNLRFAKGLWLYKLRIRVMSRRVSFNLHRFLTILVAVLGPVAVSPSAELAAQEGVAEHYLLAFVRVDNPRLIPAIHSESVPQVFSQSPFAVYLLMNRSGAPEWILCSSDGNDWDAVAEERFWNSLDVNDIRLFFSSESEFEQDDSVISTLLTHFRVRASANVSAGLLRGWNPALKLLYDDLEARSSVFSEVIPGLSEYADLYDDYVVFLAQELMSIRDISVEMNPNSDGGTTRVDVAVTPNTRLSRLISRESRSDMSILDFVPRDAQAMVFGAVDGIIATNFLNYHYKGTGKVKHDVFRAIRNGFDQLDGGVIDRWDGSWVRWTPDGSDQEVLMLGGDFQSSDLSELFDMFSNVDLKALNLAFVLDEGNSIVGFTRIRSFDLYGSIGDGSGNSDPKRYYFTVGQGKLVIAESEDYLIELVFQLNRRVGIKGSAKEMLEESSRDVVRRFESGEPVGFVRFTDNGIQYERSDSTELAQALLVTWINKLR